MADISAHPSSFAAIARGAEAPPKRSALRRALDAIMQARQQKADREVAAILAWHGKESEPRRRSDEALPGREAIRSRA